MKKLLDIPRDGGYPLCAETLELLHDNVQLLETVLNGLKLPQHTIVRFPYGDFAYVQSCNPASGNGEILKISQGESLPNANVQGYQIISLNNDVTNVNDVVYIDVYQDRSLKLTSSGSIGINVRVYDFDELFEKGMWRNGIFQGYRDREYHTLTPSDQSAIASMKWNESEIRIRVRVRFDNLPISSSSELIVLFNNAGVLDNADDIFPAAAAFNSNQTNTSVTAHISRKSPGVIQVKVLTKELDGLVQGSFTGQITINAVIAL